MVKLATFGILIVLGLSIVIGPIFINKDSLSMPISQRNQEPLKMAILPSEADLKIDSRKISTFLQSVLQRHLFSHLIGFDRDGQYFPLLAERYRVEDQALVINLRDNLLTSKGQPITPEDVVFSLMRLMVGQGNTHGNLKMIVCPEQTIVSPFDHCDGLFIRNGEIWIKPKNPDYLKFIVSILASPDHVIIPIDSVDIKSIDYPIIDYSNTTGPYFVSQTRSSGGIQKLRGNENSPLYSPAMPQNVELVPVPINQLERALKEGEIDYIPSSARISLAVYNQLKTVPNISLHKTKNIKIMMLVFGEKAQGRLSGQQRMFLGSIVERALLPYLEEESDYRTVEFFQDFSEGHLVPSQSKQILELRRKAQSSKYDFNENIRVFPHSAYPEAWKNLGKIPFVELLSDAPNPLFLPHAERPDIFIAFPDVGYEASLSMLSFYMLQGAFGKNRNDAEAWLADFIATPQYEMRLKKIQDLHFEILKECYLFPMRASPYYQVVREPWALNQSEVLGGFFLPWISWNG